MGEIKVTINQPRGNLFLFSLSRANIFIVMAPRPYRHFQSLIVGVVHKLWDAVLRMMKRSVRHWLTDLYEYNHLSAQLYKNCLSSNMKSINYIITSSRKPPAKGDIIVQRYQTWTLINKNCLYDTSRSLPFTWKKHKQLLIENKQYLLAGAVVDFKLFIQGFWSGANFIFWNFLLLVKFGSYQ